MKKTEEKIALNCLVIMFVLFGFSSCKNRNVEPESRYHYYSFNDVDKKWLLNGFKKGDVVIYVNDKKEKAIFQVNYAEITLRDELTVGMGFFTTYAAKYFEYDRQDVRLSCISTPYLGEINITIRKFPIDGSAYEVLQNPPKNKLLEQLTVQVDVPKWNYVSNTGYPTLTDALIKDDICCATPMVINNKTYNQVFTILSGNNQPYTPCPTGCLTYDVNTMLYDKEKGVVGWENIAGEKWMIE